MNTFFKSLTATALAGCIALGAPVLALADSVTNPADAPNDQQLCYDLVLTSGTSTQFIGLTATDPAGASTAGLFNLGTAGNAVVTGPDGFAGAWDAVGLNPILSGASWVNNISVAPGNPSLQAGDGQDGTVNVWRLFSQPFTLPADATINSAVLHFSADNSVNAFLDDAPIGSSPNFATITDLNPTVTVGTHAFEFVTKNDAYDGVTNPTAVIYKADINYCVPVVVVPPPPAVSCPVDTTETFVETKSVDATSVASTGSVASLVLGDSYLLKASGTWRNLPYNDSDAEFTSVDNWVTHADGYDIDPWFLGEGEFDLKVDNGFVNWGPYSATHQYSLLYTGTGAPVSLGIFDGDSNTNTQQAGWYGDNQGGLSVDIYHCVPNTPPPPPPTGSISGYKWKDMPQKKVCEQDSYDSKDKNGKKYRGYTESHSGHHYGNKKDCDNDDKTLAPAVNGVHDANEPLLDGWTIFIDLNGNKALDSGEVSTVTSGGGNYSFADLPAGTYSVCEVMQSGWQQTYPGTGTGDCHSVTLTDGQNVVDKNFGNSVVKDCKLGNGHGGFGDKDNDKDHDKDKGKIGDGHGGNVVHWNFSFNSGKKGH